MMLSLSKSMLHTVQLSTQSGVKTCMTWQPGGATEASSSEGMDTKMVPPGSSILAQSSTMIWWHSVPCRRCHAVEPTVPQLKGNTRGCKRAPLQNGSLAAANDAAGAPHRAKDVRAHAQVDGQEGGRLLVARPEQLLRLGQLPPRHQPLEGVPPRGVGHHCLCPGSSSSHEGDAALEVVRQARPQELPQQVVRLQRLAPATQVNPSPLLGTSVGLMSGNSTEMKQKLVGTNNATLCQ